MLRSRVLPVLLASLLAALAIPAGAGAQVISYPQPTLVSAVPAKATPNVLDGAVRAIVQVGNTIIAGGNFAQVQSYGSTSTLPRTNFFAFDAKTGAVDPALAPAINGEVDAVAVAADGQSIYVGGQFDTVNGAPAKSIAQIKISDGTLVPGFAPPRPNGIVYDLALSHGRLFVAGRFTTIGATTRPGLVSLDPTTGALNAFQSLEFGGVLRGGNLSVLKIAVTPDANRLVAIGNFSTVGGLSRVQVVMLDLSGSTVGVSDWATHSYEPDCAKVFDTYVRDVDISPDGSYFVIGSTGAYRANTLCDSTARWEVDSSGTDVRPTWIGYTGGDSTYAVTITGAAVYVGGHMRWQNNPFAADKAGPGAVPRQGIAALDPLNGLPLSWNPGRTRGVGVFDMLATSTGLWVGSNTDRIANRYHGRIAFMPLAGGRAIPATGTGTLPGSVYTAGPAVDTSGSNVLYRVNAAGPRLLATDDGPDWARDTVSAPSSLHNTGSSTATYTAVGAVNASVPASTPPAVFASERWDAGSQPEMSWKFAVRAGTHVAVRLYFANRCSCTSTAGKRVFSVKLDGATVLNRYDIVADTGHNVGTMKSMSVTSDGSVDIDFVHGADNPLVNAIEIVNSDATSAAPSGADTVSSRTFDGAAAAAPSVVDGGGASWSRARGAMMINGNLYTGWSDGNLYLRSYNGTTFGPAQALNLYGLTDFSNEIRNMTGMFFDHGRLYYTLADDAALYYRYFSPESGIVGAQLFVATGNVAGLAWDHVAGMFLVGGQLYYGSDDGNLRMAGFGGGVVTGAPTGPLSGPATNDGNDWRARATFLYAPAAP